MLCCDTVGSIITAGNHTVACSWMNGDTGCDGINTAAAGNQHRYWHTSTALSNAAGNLSCFCNNYHNQSYDTTMFITLYCTFACSIHTDYNIS